MDEHHLKSDEMLVAAVLSGERGAFLKLVEQYQGLISHLVFRLIGNQHDREEVCQDVFVKVYRQLKKFRFQSRLSTWISRIAYNTAIDCLKKRRLEIVDYDMNEIEQESGPANEMDDMQLTAFVHEKLKLLSVVEKSVVTLYHLEEMSVSEISQVMQRPEGTIKSDLFRARKKLRKMIKPDEYL